MNNALFLTTLLSLLLLTHALPQCSVSVIGSGLSGVYTAYRLATATDSPYKGNEVCLFEGTENLGGRLLPVLDEDGNVFEMGIEKFDTAKMPLFTELVDFLGLETECVREREVSEKRDVKGFFGAYGRDPIEGKKGERGPEVVEEIPAGAEKTVDVTVEDMPAGAEKELKEGERLPEVVEEVPAGAEKSNELKGKGEKISEEVPAGAEKELKEGERTPEEVPAGAEKSSEELKEGERLPEVVEEVPAGAEMPTEERPQEKGQWWGTKSPQDRKTPEEIPAGVEAESQCREAISKALFIRSMIVYTNETGSMLPFNVQVKLEKLKNLAHVAFETVMKDHITAEELEAIRTETDTGIRWEKVGELISKIAQSGIEYKGVPIHNLDMRMVLVDALNLSDDDIEAAVYLSDRYPRLRELMSMNFELFVIQYLRDIASGVGEERRIGSSNGMRTVIDTMATKLEEAGVQIYLNAKLTNLHITEDGIIVMKFSGIDSLVNTERLFLALNKKNLLSLSSSDLLQRISPITRETLGALRDRAIVKGIVFYDRAWWNNFDLADIIYTDTDLSMIEFHNSPNCTVGDDCSGYIRFEQWRKTNDLNFDIFNPIDMATVLSHFTTEEMEEISAGALEEESSNQEMSGKGSQSQTSQEDEFFRTMAAEMTQSQNLHKLRSRLLLDIVHRKIMNIVKGIPGFSETDIERPNQMLIANWKNDGVFNFGTLPLPGTSYANRLLALMEPIQGAPIHLVNNDFSEFTDWDHSLEASIITVERTLSDILGMEKPDFYNEKIYKSVVEV